MTRSLPQFPLPEDEASIDVKAPEVVESWAERLGVSEVDLRLAVAAVGERAQDVRTHLGV